MFDYTLAVIPPHNRLTLTVQNPPCAFQSDAFYGDLIESFAGGVRYDERRLADAYGNQGVPCAAYVTVTPSPTATGTATPSPTRTATGTATRTAPATATRTLGACVPVPVTTCAVGTAPTDIVAGDFAGDGKADLATANHDLISTRVTVLLQRPGSLASGLGLTTFDLDGDNDLDLALTTSDNLVYIVRNNGLRAFSAPSAYPTGPDPEAVISGDFNGDGRADLLVGTAGNNTVALLLQQAGGSFTLVGNYSISGSPHDLAVGDFDRDGRLDAVTANPNNNTVSVLYNNGCLP